MNEQKPVGVVIGDAAGIGPEITVKALSNASLYRACSPILIGDESVVLRALKTTQVNLEVRPISSPSEAQFRYPILDLVNVPYPHLNDIPIGKISPLAGEAFTGWFRKAIILAEAGQIGAVAYAPLNKEAVYAAGYPFHEETNMIEAFSKKRPSMLLVVSIAGRYRSASVPPLHLSLREACEKLNRHAIFQSLVLLNAGLERMGIPNPVIGVSGLNPHAGESGLHGDEETREIIPAIEDARKKGIKVNGPYPPDIIFLKAKENKFDCILGMYHDQTRIAMKLIKFGKIVYITLGASTNFVSVAHGTAYDIAGKNVADPQNMVQALKYAAKMRKLDFSNLNTMSLT